ncbi:MAG TPA: hypothetical protein VNQ77_10895 [Frankiaceae bacterium]|nr:hypothetical protein [Frankiaceae bacterium]
MSAVEDVFCVECGFRFPEGVLATQIGPGRYPCPRCGALGRRADVREAVTMGLSVSVTGKATFDRSWRAQHRRMIRAFGWLHGIAPPTPTFVVADIEDGFITFFMHAWHLKDWLRHDGLGRRVERLVQRYPALLLAADLANGVKHLRLTSTRTGDVNTAMTSLTFDGDPTDGLSASVRISSGSMKLDAVEVARDVLSAWEDLLHRAGLQ